ncbi:RNA polymerase-binding transcription factor DksA [Microbacterium sp. AK009]|uniref:TraR/DksA family transcriptional regulator n=1 Tax=Microbacterium sp. AK009 TaxID=2723068 RepID=UPI0015CB48EB|nr:TraR/DksA C4-type zinc finger protein [Microbacterium sp. AK009]NYF17745.1 RNA polymerase-binding transcription factor DksA [Microbacterium sp. AK009]
MDSPVVVLRAARDSARRRLAEVEVQLMQLREARGAESADDEHDPEGGTLSAEWSRIEGVRVGVLTELEGIDAALDRVAAGTFGICEVCGTAIPEGRLEVRPTATRCVRCAELRQ